MGSEKKSGAGTTDIAELAGILREISSILVHLADHNYKLTQQVVELRREFRGAQEAATYNNVKR